MKKKIIEEIGEKVKNLLDNGEATKDKSVNFKIVVLGLLLVAAFCVAYYFISAIF